MIAFTAGFSLGLSLIIVIGAQNAFVLRQGLNRAHVFAVCLVCAASDAALIVAGVSGFHVLVGAYPGIDTVARYGGAAFLFAYGARSFYVAARRAESLQAAARAKGALAAAVATAVALTWLNPHVYLDTVVLLGSVSTQYAGQRPAFAAGATLASFAFFFALGYGARILTPLFSRPAAWKILDAAIGAVMWSVAASLLIGT